MAQDYIEGEYKVQGASVKTKFPKKYQTKSLEEISRKYFRIAQAKTVRYGADTLRAEIKNSNKVASGNLLKSVSSEYVEGRANKDINFESKLYFKDPGGKYAGFANEGRGRDKNPPNPVGSKASGIFKGPSPMVRAIENWMLLKGIDKKYLFYIVRNIKFFGTSKKGTKFFERAQAKIKVKNKENFEKAVAAIKAELNG